MVIDILPAHLTCRDLVYSAATTCAACDYTELRDFAPACLPVSHMNNRVMLTHPFC